MRRLILFLKITTFLLLIWMYLCFHNCFSYKTLIDKNILQIKNELKYERVLTEGDIEEKKKNYAEGFLEECSLDKEKKKKNRKNPVQYENPYDIWQRDTTPYLWEQFKKETSEMDHKWRDEKWNNEWNRISANKVKELSSIFHRSDISEEEKEKLIDCAEKEIYKLFVKFLDECKTEMRGNKTESESKNEMTDNKTESESNNEMTDNKTESESKNEMTDNKTESESKNEKGKNKIKNKKSNILKFLFKRFDNH
ncbi:fam-g protein [Plasmodium gallinaceum]|uniref:Fam-g protein n=1 Tax=Plasmodium gallinaceum TaxID=5849 RepID=A0A1J1GRZ9_PLAGA|nr:fam-g protein [Plasmodium gallinaceum]CRG94080.1 fam-g protein [Plasmodium gallinaceum]